MKFPTLCFSSHPRLALTGITWNVSLGSEIQINKFLFTRFGFLTDNSSAPDATVSGDITQPDKIDRYGLQRFHRRVQKRQGPFRGRVRPFREGHGDWRTWAFTMSPMG
jgi:hypothetical protein